MKKVLVALLFFIFILGIVFTNSYVLPWMYKINFVYRVSHDNFSKSYLESLSNKDRKFIEDHVVQAISHLKHKENEYEIAGAINDYLFQFLILENSQGSPYKLLKNKRAICGGHAVLMSMMLSLCGISNHTAYLIDIPYQGAHSLVQVQFKNGVRNCLCESIHI